MTRKKKAAKRSAKNSKALARSNRSSVNLAKHELRVKFSNSHDLLDKLISLSQSVSRLHTHTMLANQAGTTVPEGSLDYMSPSGISDVLGPEKAFEIVTECAAGETDLTKKLSDIPGITPVLFQSCVRSEVTKAGCTPGYIPAGSDNTLWDVVQAIQGCSMES